jgi:hypothetical protein
MKCKNPLLLAALTISLTGAFVANAAGEKPVTDAKAEKAQPAKQEQPPDNAVQNKQGTTGKAGDTCCRNPSQADKKPTHDHH